MEIVDHRMVGALRVGLLGRAAAGADAAADVVFQTSTLEALLDGAYEGDLTVGELLEHGDLGIGTVDHLDGELVVVDGAAFVVRSDGTVESVAAATGTPFAAVCRFRPGSAVPLPTCADVDALTTAIDAAAPPGPVIAVRVDGRFARLVVRSVARQEPPYPPLREVVAHQREWELADVDGTVVGFRFPDVTGGLEVPGWHLHAIDDHRTVGGHVIDVRLTSGSLRVEAVGDLHVEVPPGIGEVELGRADRTGEIAAVERQRRR